MTDKITTEDSSKGSALLAPSGGSAWGIMQQLARRHLGDLGAAEKFVDAKQDWGDD